MTFAHWDVVLLRDVKDVISVVQNRFSKWNVASRESTVGLTQYRDSGKVMGKGLRSEMLCFYSRNQNPEWALQVAATGALLKLKPSTLQSHLVLWPSFLAVDILQLVHRKLMQALEHTDYKFHSSNVWRILQTSPVYTRRMAKNINKSLLVMPACTFAVWSFLEWMDRDIKRLRVIGGVNHALIHS